MSELFNRIGILVSEIEQLEAELDERMLAADKENKILWKERVATLNHNLNVYRKKIFFLTALCVRLSLGTMLDYEKWCEYTVLGHLYDIWMGGKRADLKHLEYKYYGSELSQDK